MHGGKRTPNAGRPIRRNQRGLSASFDDAAPAAVVFMGQDRIERSLAHDTDAYRVRRMLEGRDLWTVIPERPVGLVTDFELEFFEDESVARLFSQRQDETALRHKRRLHQLALSRHNQRRVRNGMKPLRRMLWE